MADNNKKLLQEHNSSIKRRLLIIIGVLLFLLFLISFFYHSPREAEVKLVEAVAFEQIIQDEETFVLNTHTPYEGEIEGTDLIIEDWQNIALYQDKLPADKDIPIAVYCRSGRMSAEAAKQLVDLGYKNIYDLKGGINAWKESGRKIVTK